MKFHDDYEEFIHTHTKGEKNLLSHFNEASKIWEMFELTLSLVCRSITGFLSALKADKVVRNLWNEHLNIFIFTAMSNRKDLKRLPTFIRNANIIFK